jgi:hypothetical protein
MSPPHTHSCDTSCDQHSSLMSASQYAEASRLQYSDERKEVVRYPTLRADTSLSTDWPAGMSDMPR